MKKLFSLLFVVFLSLQMWGATYYAYVFVVGSDNRSRCKVGVSTTSNVTIDNYSMQATCTSCHQEGSFTAYYKVEVTDPNYRFAGWSTSSSYNSKYSTELTCTKAASTGSGTQLYVWLEENDTKVSVSVAVATNSTGMGTVSGGANNVSAGKTDVTITASANSDYYFKGWSTNSNGSGALVGTASYTFKPSATATYYAVFGAYKTSTVSLTDNNSNTSWVTSPNIAGAVDLGLPSGLLWAEKNIDVNQTNKFASSATSYGSYFAWGETAAMTGNAAPSASTYGFKDSQYDSYNTLPATYDAATVNLGNGWRMPTRAEFQELIEHADWSFSYYWYVSGNNNTIIFPLGGQIFAQKYATGTSDLGRYWTSDKFSGEGSMKRPYYVALTTTAYSVTYDNSQYSTNCYAGYSIRPVHDGAAAKVLTIQVKVGSSVVATHTYRCNDGEKVKITASDVEGYEFTNWKDGNSVLSTNATQEFTVTTDKTYTANYTQSVTYVTATFNNYNGTQLAQYTNVVSGTTPTYSGDEPTRPNDQTESTVTTYEFTGWSPALGNISTNTTYTAQFSSSTTPRTYTIRFFMEAGDETPIQTLQVAYNELPVCTASVTKTADTYWTYEFAGWDGNNDGVADGVSAVTGDKDYVAVFTKTSTGVIPNYNVIIDSYSNGSVTLTANGQTEVVPTTGGTYPYEDGTTIIVKALPAKGYHFNQWNDAVTTANRQIEEISANVTLTPAFATNVPFNMYDTWTQADCSDNYNYDDYLTVTLVGRTFTAGQWATLSVPFDYTLTADDALYNTIYKFTNVTLSSGGSSVYLEFVRTNDIEKNEPYLVVPRQAGINEVVFDGVKLETPVQKTPTTDNRVAFVSTLWQQEISGPNDFYIGKLSTLYYAPNSGMTIKGNRAFFRKIGDAASAPRRVIIVIDGEEVEVEIAGDAIEEVQDVRKYMENGILIIERNGVRMDAQGKRIN